MKPRAIADWRWAGRAAARYLDARFNGGVVDRKPSDYIINDQDPGDGGAAERAVAVEDAERGSCCAPARKPRTRQRIARGLFGIFTPFEKTGGIALSLGVPSVLSET